MSAARNQPAPGASNYGWTRSLESGNASYSPRVWWAAPGAAVGAFRVYASKTGVGLVGQYHGDPGSIPSLNMLLALAAHVSQQMAAGVDLSALVF